MDRDDFALQFLAMLLCFALGAFLSTALRPQAIYITRHQQRTLCSREQKAVVSQWRVWTEQAAAANECRGYVLHGDEP